MRSYGSVAEMSSSSLSSAALAPISTAWVRHALVVGDDRQGVTRGPSTLSWGSERIRGGYPTSSTISTRHSGIRGHGATRAKWLPAVNDIGHLVDFPY